MNYEQREYRNEDFEDDSYIEMAKAYLARQQAEENGGDLKMDRAEHIRALQAEYAQLQAQDRREAEARLRECWPGDRNRRAQNPGRGHRPGSHAGDDAPDGSGKTAAGGGKNAPGRAGKQQELRLRLTALGLPEDYLEEKYRCEKCRDTGYTNDIPAGCECFQKALRLRMFEDGTMAGLDRQNFTIFRMSW